MPTTLNYARLEEIPRLNLVGDLADMANRSSDKKIKALGDKLIAAAVALVPLLVEEQKAQEVEAANAIKLAAIEVKIADARAALEAAAAERAKLAPTKKKPSARPDGEAAKIRAWAQENGVEVPGRGRVPDSVRKQYDAAHPVAS